jgi:hypothetical protein
MVHAVESGAECFGDILVALPGVYPPVALESLRRLTLKGQLPERTLSEAEIYIRSASVIGSDGHPKSRLIILPVPHPLDYEWRFSDASANELASEASSLLGSEGTLAMLGSPSVFRAALERGVCCRPFILDRSQIITECLREVAPVNSVLCCDVTQDELPVLRAGAVIVDPPWYEEYIRSFAWAACRISVPGARIFFSLPPVGTRPGVDQELEDFFSWSREALGFELDRLAPGALPYETPAFERNALKAEGFHNVPSEWRRGDLAVFVRTPKELPGRPVTNVTESFDDGIWAEETIEGVRIRVRCGSVDDEEMPAIISIVDRDVLPTVSRRDERRKMADMWTSGNRVFRCRGLRVLRHILHALSTGATPMVDVANSLGRPLNASEAESISRVAGQILKLVHTELSEYSYT